MSLEGKIAIVTGAAQGLGRSTALRLSGAGAKIALIDIDRDTLDQVSTSIVSKGGEARSFVVDITDSGAVGNTVSAILEACEAYRRNGFYIGWRIQDSTQESPFAAHFR